MAKICKTTKREIPYEDAMMYMDTCLKKKPQKSEQGGIFSGYRAKNESGELLSQILPGAATCPPWYNNVYGDIYAEDHWEAKEVFRSLSRKLSAINPTFIRFYNELYEAVPNKPVESAALSGCELELPTEFVNYTGRRLQVNGKIEKSTGKVVEFQDSLLGMYDHRKDPWQIDALTIGALSAKDATTGYLAMSSHDTKSGEELEIACPVVRGGAHGARASIGNSKFQYVGDYKDGKFHGQGKLSVYDEKLLPQFGNLKRYE